jgi:DNA mismatch endonuclease, patch repair protein
MVGKRPRKIVSFNMSKIRSQGTKLEATLETVLKSIPEEYVKQPKIFGKPDFVYADHKIAIFADSDFWHGYDWESKKLEIKTNKDFWIPKIERNIERDKEVTITLERDGWRVVRLWGHDILKHPENCRAKIIQTISNQNLIKSF